MVFSKRDVDADSFWGELAERGRIGDLPPPDIIHCSPPCSVHSRIKRFAPNHAPPTEDELGRVERLICRLRRVEAASSQPLMWQVENVPECLEHVKTPVTCVLLCGVMMGHRVFRHRVFLCNYQACADLPHDHRGKHVGARGLPSPYSGPSPDPNMYGVLHQPSGDA